MSGRDEQLEWIAGALNHVGADIDVDVRAAMLYAQGVRVLGPDEAIITQSEHRLLVLVRQAAERWETMKRAAVVRSDESDRTTGVKPPWWIRTHPEAMPGLLLSVFQRPGVATELTQENAIRWAALDGGFAASNPEHPDYQTWRNVFAQLVNGDYLEIAPRSLGHACGPTTLYRLRNTQ